MFRSLKIVGDQRKIMSKHVNLSRKYQNEIDSIKILGWKFFTNKRVFKKRVSISRMRQISIKIYILFIYSFR